MKKLFSGLFVFFLLLTCGCSGKKTEEEGGGREVEIAKAVSEKVPYYIQTIGNAEAYRSVDITPQVEGKITGFYFTDGTDVSKGDRLFTIEKEPYLASLEEAEGQLRQAEASLVYQTQKVASYQNLLPEDYVSKLDFQQYVSQAKTSEGQLEQYQGAVLKAKVNVDWCTINSPIDGRCGKHEFDPGNVVRANQEEALVTINQITPIYVLFTVPERYLPQIQKYQSISQRGLEVSLVTLGDKEKTYSAYLDFIDNTVDKETGTLQLRAVAANDDKALWPGQFLHINLILYHIDDAVLVPETAIGNDTKGTFVFIAKDDGTVELRRVSVGQRHRQNIVVEEGVTAGENVVSVGKDMLKPGDRYRVKEREENSQPGKVNK